MHTTITIALFEMINSIILLSSSCKNIVGESHLKLILHYFFSEPTPGFSALVASLLFASSLLLIHDNHIRIPRDAIPLRATKISSFAMI
jgi:hypothetical protein